MYSMLRYGLVINFDANCTLQITWFELFHAAYSLKDNSILPEGTLKNILVAFRIVTIAYMNMNLINRLDWILRLVEPFDAICMLATRYWSNEVFQGYLRECLFSLLTVHSLYGVKWRNRRLCDSWVMACSMVDR